MQVSIHPYTRIIFFLAGISGAILCNSNIVLLIFWLAVLLPLMIVTKNIKIHFAFLYLVVLPMSIMLSFLYWVVLHNALANFDNVILIVLKLIIYTTVVQFVLLIPSNQLYYTFKKFGMRGSTLITALGSYIVWVDVINRSNKILTARFARGFVSKRTFFAKLMQLPHLLIPLIIGIMRTAAERSESWEQKKIFYRIDTMKTDEFKYSLNWNIVIIIIALSWLVLNTLLLWK